MTDDRRLSGLLDEVFAAHPTTAPDRLRSAVLADLADASQRPALRTRLRRASPRPAVMAVAAAAIVILAIASIQLAPWQGAVGPHSLASPGPSSMPQPTPTASAPALPTPVVLGPSTPQGSNVAPLAIEGLTGSLPLDRVLTSELFRPTLTFRLHGNASGHSEICSSPETSDRSIVLRHVMGCVQDIRIVRPWAVDCGTAAHPDAAELATALLANPDLSASQRPAEPVADLFAAQQTVWYIGIDLRGRFDGGADDPGHCRLLPDPDSRDPVVEIRGDVSQRLVLLDVANELVVIRMSVGGYDRYSGREATARGYAAGGLDAFDHLGQIVRGLDFAAP